MFILEVAAAIAAFVMQTQVRSMLMRTMNDSLMQYYDNEYVEVGVDFMQATVSCPKVFKVFSKSCRSLFHF